jgi:hypothetical protein
LALFDVDPVFEIPVSEIGIRIKPQELGGRGGLKFTPLPGLAETSSPATPARIEIEPLRLRTRTKIFPVFGMPEILGEPVAR